MHNETTSTSTHLNALLVSDIHDDHQSLNRLVTWLQSTPNQPRFDIVLYSGDMSNAPATSLHEEAFEKSAISALRTLARLAPTFFVPGNHDHLSFFNTSRTQRLGPRIHNVHGRCVELRPGLWIYGWGGSSTAQLADVRVSP